MTLGEVVGLFEEEITRFADVSHAVAVSSCTSGLMMALAALALPEGVEVVVPSFTFAATVQPLLWNRLTPVYVDCLPGTMTIDPDEVAKAISPNTRGILGVNIYGLPPDIEPLEAIAEKYGLALLFDSAQGLGASYHGRPAGGFGACEVFSFSPTKVITAIEGGVVTTRDAGLALKLRSMRDYGKGPDGEEMVFTGLSARMSEFHGAVGLLSLRQAESLIASRWRLIQKYRERLAGLQGCNVQEFPEDRSTNGNYFVLLVGDSAKVNRDILYDVLKSHGIQSKRYFHPPVHAQQAFRSYPHRVVGDLRNTWRASRQALALPLYAHMTDDEHGRVCDMVRLALR
jgi:dTDP-4-amino-4,6-dideoxygalactose transaminase